MSESLNRRNFLKKSVIASTTAALGLSFEEKALSAKTTKKTSASESKGSAKTLPMGKIGNVKISKLICGGNLINGYAHSRDLIYVSSLLKKYFTDEKVIETFHKAEENGINTVIANNNPWENTIRILHKYWKERGGKIQWIAQTNPEQDDLRTNIRMAIDNGAIGAFIQGGIGDDWAKDGRLDLIGNVISFIKENGLIAGIAGHSLEVPMACERAAIEPDFYMKTFHSDNYWSHSLQNTHDNVWAKTPQKTIEFMEKVNTPWIAYKVLAAGAIHPREGFKHAFTNGADFIAAGMFDFQISEDVKIARKILSGKLDRKRPWRA